MMQLKIGRDLRDGHVLCAVRARETKGGVGDGLDGRPQYQSVSHGRRLQIHCLLHLLSTRFVDLGFHVCLAA